MKLLLDTHVFLWAIAEPGRIAREHRSRIESRANTVYVSAVSIAELAIKASLGKLALTFNPVQQVADAGFELLDFAGRDALHLKDLPFHHRDPFDRMLIAQSVERNIPILTHDPAFRQYACRLVWT